MTLPASPLVSFEEMQRWAKASCKIILGPCSWGSGFFVVFRIHENQVLYGVMTNNHVLDENRLTVEQNVQVRLHNDQTITVQLRRAGIRFTCPLLDVTFIELKEVDVLTVDHHGVKFLNVSGSSQCTRPGTEIAIMQYPKNHSMLAFAQGTVYSLWGTCILHDVSTNYGSSGSGIVSMRSREVVAIHCARRPDMKVNVGVRASVAIQALLKKLSTSTLHITNQLKISTIANYGNLKCLASTQQRTSFCSSVRQVFLSHLCGFIAPTMPGTGRLPDQIPTTK